MGKKELIEDIFAFCRSTGPAMSPFSAWVLSKSLETLDVRMERHAKNALHIATTLQHHPKISFLKYPFLPSHLLMLACSFMLGVLLGGVQPTVMILIHHITPPQRHGDAMATRFIMINASAISMPMLYGAAGGFVSVSGVFLAAAGVVGLGAALGFWSERNHSADGPD